MRQAAALLGALAQRQSGAFSAYQASLAGYSASAIDTSVAVGRWERLHRSVFAIRGTADSPERRHWAAWLALGADCVVGRRSGLWLWDMASAPIVPEFIVPPTHSARLPGVAVLRMPLRPVDTSRRAGLIVTTPTRSLFDSAAVLTTRELEDAYDRGAAKRLYAPAHVLAELDRTARPGRAGSKALRRVLLAQGVGSERSPSYLESKALRLFRRAGLPEPKVELVWGERGQFRLDFIWVEFGLVVEVDGWETHASHRARQYDLSRRNQIVLGDLRVLIYTYDDIVRRSAATVAEILDAIALRAH